MSPRLALLVATSSSAGSAAAALAAGASPLAAVAGALAAGGVALGCSHVFARRSRAALDKAREVAREPSDERAVLALVGEVEEQRRRSAEREKLFASVAHDSPMGIVMLADAGRVVYSNKAARDLFSLGQPLEGEDFLALLSRAPEPMRDAFLETGDAVFTVDEGEERETFHLVKKPLSSDEAGGLLLLVRRMTRELRRQEVEAWKKLLRVLSHELNNSLAPISSLVHSARKLANGERASPERLGAVFDTIEERTLHLSEFLGGYARLARLPAPRPTDVSLPELLERIQAMVPVVTIVGAPPATAWLDPTQIEQVLINLLKNADEAGGPKDAITLEVSGGDDGDLSLSVGDRGSGMPPEVLESAMLPFFTTKERGTGLGLAVSREIVEAHGGKLRIENRPGGGVLVRVWLPGQGGRLSRPARLTLTRG